MNTKVITLEVLEGKQNAIGYVTLTNSKGDTFEILDSYRNEELIDFIKRSDDIKKKSVGKNI
jgi:fructose-1,6-bisphosphatase